MSNVVFLEQAPFNFSSYIGRPAHGHIIHVDMCFKMNVGVVQFPNMNVVNVPDAGNRFCRLLQLIHINLSRTS